MARVIQHKKDTFIFYKGYNGIAYWVFTNGKSHSAVHGAHGPEGIKNLIEQKSWRSGYRHHYCPYIKQSGVEFICPSGFV